MWAGTDTTAYVVRSISPDGRYLLEADPYGEFGVRDLTTGVWRELDGNEVSGFVPKAIFSPTGDRIISLRYSESLDDYELWIQGFSTDDDGTPRGGTPRLVAPYDPGLATYILGGWSDEDEILTAVWRPGGTLALALLSLRTDEIRVLKSLAWDEPEVTMTRDARLIAYSVPASDDRDDSDIFLIADGTREIPLAEGPSDDRVLGWLPGTTDLLFVSDRSGSPGIWRQPIVDERPAGPPVLLRDELWNLQSIRGVSRDAFYYSVRVENPRFVTARLDAETGALLPMPAVFDDGRGGRVRTIEWSPDGNFVAHDLVGPTGPLRIVVRTADGQVVREWPFDLNMSRVALRWTPDGDAILLNAFDSRGREGLRRIDLQTGEVDVIRLFGKGEGNPGNPGGFAIAADGRTLAFVYRDFRHEGQSTIATVVRDLASGRERAIHTMGEGGVLEYSPDGAWLAVLEASHIRIRPQSLQLLPADGGEPRVLHRFEPDAGSYSIAGWSADSAWIYLNFNPARDGQPTELWRLATSGEGGPEVVATGTARARLHPDGARIAYLTGRTQNEIWALDGFAQTSANATAAP